MPTKPQSNASSVAKETDIVTAILQGETELWLHDDQKKAGWGVDDGRKILAYLTENGLLPSFADASELKAIQAMGLSFFLKLSVYNLVGWRGVEGGGVPYLFVLRGKVEFGTCRLEGKWNMHSPGIRRK